jgi:hypothetical protein
MRTIKLGYKIKGERKTKTAEELFEKKRLARIAAALAADIALMTPEEKKGITQAKRLARKIGLKGELEVQPKRDFECTPGAWSPAMVAHVLLTRDEFGPIVIGTRIIAATLKIYLSVGQVRLPSAIAECKKSPPLSEAIANLRADIRDEVLLKVAKMRRDEKLQTKRQRSRAAKKGWRTRRNR